jgi:hypothetical protein
VDASLVVCNLGDVFLAVCGPVHGRLREVESQVVALREVSQRQGVEFQVAYSREVSRRQVVVVRGVQSQVAGSVDYRRRVDRPSRVRQEVARRSVDDSLKSPLQRHRPVAYLDDRD